MHPQKFEVQVALMATNEITVQMDKIQVSSEKKRTEGGRLTKSSGPSITGEGDNKIGGEFTIGPNPEFIARRVAVYDRIMEKQRAIIEGQ